MSQPSCDVPDLAQTLRRLIGQVPAGRVTTCGALAEALGNRIAARWVGHYTLHHAHGPACPCHRVLRAGGPLGGYVAGGREAKARRLADEGVEVRGETVDLDRFGFDGFQCDRPLERLRGVQEALVEKVSLRPTAGSRRPIFVSPGHRVNLARAECVVRRLLTGRRLPEPLYWADRLSRAAGRQ